MRWRRSFTIGLVVLIVVGGLGFGAHAFVKAATSGLCGTIDLSRLRDARQAVLAGQGDQAFATSECSDTDGGTFVEATTSGSFDCSRAQSDFEVFFHAKARQPSRKMRARIDDPGPYVQDDNDRYFLACDSQVGTIYLSQERG